MIISASRRTDIPAFYSDWLINRLQEGFVYVNNPLNSKQISNVPLNKEVVDCIVFWTKNALPILDKLDMIDSLGYKYYFQFTLTPYDVRLEKNLKNKAAIMKTFKTLSSKIGKQRVIWRYDPIIVNEIFPVEYHLNSFAKLCDSLSGFTGKCIFSFVELYAKVKRNAKDIIAVSLKDKHKIARGFSEIAKSSNIVLETCSGQVDFSKYGIGFASCVDGKLIEDIIGYPIEAKKDTNQRPHCRCIQSIDIGAYDSCAHGCVYCYASSSQALVHRNIERCDDCSPILTGGPVIDGIVTTKKVKTLKIAQTSLGFL